MRRIVEDSRIFWQSPSTRFFLHLPPLACQKKGSQIFSIQKKIIYHIYYYRIVKDTQFTLEKKQIDQIIEPFAERILEARGPAEDSDSKVCRKWNAKRCSQSLEAQAREGGCCIPGIFRTTEIESAAWLYLVLSKYLEN